MLQRFEHTESRDQKDQKMLKFLWQNRISDRLLYVNFMFLQEKYGLEALRKHWVPFRCIEEGQPCDIGQGCPKLRWHFKTAHPRDVSTEYSWQMLNSFLPVL